MTNPHGRYFTSPDWVNRTGPVLSDWPQKKKKSGDLSRVRSSAALKAKALIERLKKEGW